MLGQASNVTKKDLIDGIVERTGEKRALVKVIVEKLLETIMDELRDGKRIELRQFGIFEIKHRAPRLAQNPKTLEKVRVPAKGTVKFKPSRQLKNHIAETTPDTADEVPSVNVVRRSDGSILETKSPQDQPSSRDK